ncbi:MAG: hypothetical protein R2911_45160 [Caldilineaceae bacterium]
MLTGGAIFAVATIYVGVLFAIAYYADQRADAGRSLINNPYVYALSMAVYCTAWTFYGSVGQAARTGIGFLPIYIGPTLMAALWWFVLRKIIRISKVNRITSIADLIASRYGKSPLLGGLVAIIALLGTIPYIALQLKAIATSFTLLWTHPDLSGAQPWAITFCAEHGLLCGHVAGRFCYSFGTRHLDVTEHHEGLVAAIAFESLIKLLAPFWRWGSLSLLACTMALAICLTKRPPSPPCVICLSCSPRPGRTATGPGSPFFP